MSCECCGDVLTHGGRRFCPKPNCQRAKLVARRALRAQQKRRRYEIEPKFREKTLAVSAQWRTEHPDRMIASRNRYMEANREKRLASWSECTRRRKALKKSTMVLPFTAAQLAQRMAVYDRCWICGIASWEEVDHVKPLAKGGPHILANLRPACRNCNRRKLATWPIDTTVSRKV